jgi:hypothetical protein
VTGWRLSASSMVFPMSLWINGNFMVFSVIWSYHCEYKIMVFSNFHSYRLQDETCLCWDLILLQCVAIQVSPVWVVLIQECTGPGPKLWLTRSTLRVLGWWEGQGEEYGLGLSLP